MFIKRPMCWQYYFSLVLEFPVIFWVCKNIPETKWEWVLISSYFILSLFFYKLSYKYTKEVFRSVKSQLDRYPTTNILHYFVLSILAFFKYIFLAVFLKIAIPKIPDVIIFSLIVYFVFSIIIFSASYLPPIVIVMYVAIPLALFSLVGIEKSLLSWTFVSLLLISIIPQFINEDVEELLPRNLLKVLTGNQNKKNTLPKEKFLKLKYQIFIFVPFLYVALVVAERIIYSNEFNYLFNYIFDRHDNLQNIGYLSQTNLMITGIKMLIVLFFVIPYFEYSNYIINEISKFLIKVIEKSDKDIEYSGVYIRVKYKRLRKKWIVDNSDYYFCYKRWFYNHKEGSYYLSRKDILTSNKEKKIKPITDEIFRVEGDYYVGFNSSILRQLPSSNKSYGYKLLNRPDHSVMFFPLTIIILIFLSGWYVDIQVHKNFRGDYVLANIKNGNINSVDEAKKIQFKNDEISLDKRKYKVDNVRMQIQDDNAEVVGVYSRQGILVLKEDSQNEDYYILKSSQLYKNIINR